MEGRGWMWNAEVCKSKRLAWIRWKCVYYVPVIGRGTERTSCQIRKKILLMIYILLLHCPENPNCILPTGAKMPSTHEWMDVYSWGTWEGNSFTSGGILQTNLSLVYHAFSKAWLICKGFCSRSLVSDWLQHFHNSQLQTHSYIFKCHPLGTVKMQSHQHEPHFQGFFLQMLGPLFKAAYSHHWSIWHQLTHHADIQSNPQSTSKLWIRVWSSLSLCFVQEKKPFLITSFTLVLKQQTLEFNICLMWFGLKKLHLFCLDVW